MNDSEILKELRLIRKLLFGIATIGVFILIMTTSEQGWDILIMVALIGILSWPLFRFLNWLAGEAPKVSEFSDEKTKNQDLEERDA